MIKKLNGSFFEKNSKIVIFIFFSTLFFQITAYKFIWGLEWLSRIVNIGVLIAATGYSIASIAKSIANRVFYIYLMPVSLVFLGMFLNIALNSIININVANQFGLIMPWVVCILIPGFVKSNKIDAKSLWRYFHFFMLASVILSVSEYFALFSGFVSPRRIVTSGGAFLAGNFTILYELQSGEFHYRFYGAFLEPGTLAMFLLPVIAYTFLCRKYLSLSVYLFSLILTDSLGGFIGVLIIIPFMIYFRIKKNVAIWLLTILISAVLLSTFFYNEIALRYENKGASAEIREDNITSFISSLPELIMKYPLGLPLSISTEDAMNHAYYKGSNFSPGVAFNYGGIFAFLGYIFTLMLSLTYAVISLGRRALSVEEQVVVISIFSLFPFIFQGTVIWDSALFALLYSPFIVKFLNNYRYRN